MSRDDRSTIEVGVALFAVAVGGLVAFRARNPNAVISMAVIAVVVAAVIGIRVVSRSSRSRAWRRAVREARWVPVSSLYEGQDAIVMERVADTGARREDVEPPRLFEKLPEHGSMDSYAWDAYFAEVMGRAENRAIVLNASLNRQ